MYIGIDLENYESPMEDTVNLVNNYSPYREIGFLKLNPERVPVITSSNKYLSAISRYGSHLAVFTLTDGHYALVVDDRGITIQGNDLVVMSNAYIARVQGNTLTSLTMEEIEEWLDYIPKIHGAKVPVNGKTVEFEGICFERDAETGCWR